MEYKISELIYNLPYINGQYYIADNGNYRFSVYDIHKHLGNKSMNDDIIEKFEIIKDNIKELNKKINYNFNFDMNTNDFDKEFHNFSLFFNKLQEEDNELQENKELQKKNKELFNELKEKNYYFFGGYKGHSVLIYKYDNYIIIGNVGGASKLDNSIIQNKKKLIRAINYYNFEIQHIYFLYHFMDDMYENIYEKYLNKMILKNESDLIYNNINLNVEDTEVTKRPNKILNYELKLDKQFFYLEPQDEGTCTWHTCLLLDIFQNYYLNIESINLTEKYDKKKEDILKWLSTDEFKTFKIENINLLLIQYLGLGLDKNDLKKELKFFFKNNKMYQLDDIKEEKKNEFVLDSLFIKTKIDKPLKRDNITKNIHKYLNSKDISLDISIQPEVLIHNIKKILEVLDGDAMIINRSDEYKDREIYDSNIFICINIYEIFKYLIRKDKLGKKLNKEFEEFYREQDNINKLNNFLQKFYPAVEVDNVNIDIVYFVLKISYYFFRFDLKDNKVITDDYMIKFIQNNGLYDNLIKNYNNFYSNIEDVNYLQLFKYEDNKFNFIKEIKKYNDENKSNRDYNNDIKSLMIKQEIKNEFENNIESLIKIICNKIDESDKDNLNESSSSKSNS